MEHPLKQLVNFGGQWITVAEARRIMQAEGLSQVLIDRWLQGAMTTDDLPY